MSENTSNGGPAFPQINRWDAETMSMGPSGMTLRDYFAAKAMQALLREAYSPDGNWHVEANASYLIADAMLGARSA